MTTTKIPRHSDVTADHVTFRDIYRSVTGKFWDLTHHDRRRQTAIIPAVGALLPLLEDRIEAIETFGGVHVTVDPHFIPGECTWCDGDRPAITSVRIHGDPAGDDLAAPLVQAETCFECAISPRGAIHQARVEQNFRSRKDLLIEVCE